VVGDTFYLYHPSENQILLDIFLESTNNEICST